MTYVTKAEIYREAVRDLPVLEQLLPDRVQRQLVQHCVSDPPVVLVVIVAGDGGVTTEIYSGFDDRYPLPKILRGVARKIYRRIGLGVPT